MKKRIITGFLAVITVIALTACGGEKADTASYKSESYMANDSYAEEAAYASDDIYEASASYEQSAESGSEGISEVNVADSRKIIKNVNMSVETEEFDQFIANVEAKVNNLGGYIESSNINGNSMYASSKQKRYADITARIPANRLDDFVTVIEAKSNVLNKSLSAEDITLSYSDTQEHLNSLKVEQKRLEDLLLQADDIDTLIAIERRLTDIRYEIESYGSRLKTMDNQVDYSTVYLSVSEVVEYTEPEPEKLSFGQRISRGLKESFSNLGEDLADFIVGLIVALPYIIVVLFFITIFVFICAKFIQFIIFICSSPQKREEKRVKRAERKIKTQEKAAEIKKKLDEKKTAKEATKVDNKADNNGEQ